MSSEQQQQRQRIELSALALSRIQLPACSYSFTATRQLEDGVCACQLAYANPWVRIEIALRIAPDWYLTLEHSQLGAWVLGGFHDWHHYQFRALEDTELPQRASLFWDWALALKARHFDAQAGVI